ncbi:MAG: SDR family NAD(P)-dependent oxidoreductase [Myxococcota bacterium]
MTDRVALVQGANRGLGLAFVRELLADPGYGRVIATCRRPEDAAELNALAENSALELRRLDVTDEASMAAAAEGVNAVHLLLNVSGLLHRGDAVQPEKKLGQLDPSAMAEVFAINAFGPALVAKHFAEALTRHKTPAVLANLSARVGSVGDNRLGGWYSYRASKAAQNMFTKNLSIELTRRNPQLVVLALHPGTVDTGLSKPFQRGVPEGKLFDAERAARQLLSICARATPEENGAFFDWAGASVPW